MRLQRKPIMRWIDRQAGRPLVGASRLLVRKRAFPSAVERIGVLKVGAIGDTVLVSSIVADLADRFPGARIVLFGGPHNAPIARLIPELTEVVTLPKRPRGDLRVIRSHRLDLLVDCESWLRVAALYAAWSGARFTVGFDTAGQGRGGLHDATARHGDQVHEVDNYRALLEVIGVPTGHMPRLVAPGVLASCSYPEGPFAVLHPWPSEDGDGSRDWPFDRWAELAVALQHRGLEVVITGGPADVDRSEALCSLLRKNAVDVTDVAGKMSLPAVADLLVSSLCVVSVNTGIMHIAAALGVPTLGLNGPTASHRWGPVGPRVASVDSALPGCGFLNLGWEYKGQRHDCMEGISVAAVIEALDDLMDEAGDATWTVAH